AAETVDKSFEGLRHTKTAASADKGVVILLVVRPQEAVAAVQALAQAYNDYFGAVADYDRAQFRLFRALGQPSQLLAEAGDPGCPSEALAPPLAGPCWPKINAFSPTLPFPAAEDRR